MKKGVLLAFLLLTLVFASFASAAEIDVQSEKVKIDKAYECLEGKIANRSSLSLGEAIFGTLASGSKQKLTGAIQSSKNEKESCWPKACKIKETAQVGLAYNRIGSQTQDIEKWLESKKGIPTELTWYLEVDSVQHIPALCTFRYDGRDYKVNIKEDMTLSGGAGSCLSLSSSGYWLKINNNCLTKSFEISCDQNFVTSLVYQKNKEGSQDCLDDKGNTCYISSKTSSASSLGTTNESVQVSCFKSGSGCDYEGSLWAAHTLQILGKDISDTIPYLVALADENQKYFPSSFLYILTGEEEYYSQIIQNRKQNQFWEFTGHGYTRFYDTSLGMLSLGSSSEGEAEAAKTQSYLLGIQSKEGCWNNGDILDTSFILYSGWKKGAVGGIPRPGSSLISCVEGGFSCERLSECTEAGGVKKEGFECSSAASVCCSVKIPKKSCVEEKGKICKVNEECDAQSVESSDGACCLGSCIESSIDSCETSGGICQGSCDKGYEEVEESCTGGEVCCVLSEDPEESGSGWIWVIILGILVVLIAIAIKFKDKIRLWWFKQKGKASSSPVTRPGIPPSGGSGATSQFRNPLGNFMPRPVQRPVQRPQSRGSAKDAEMEETLRKLRDMGK